MNNDKAKSIVKKVSFWSMLGILGIVLLFILMEAIIPNQTINVFQVRTYIAEYSTMEPTIKYKDLVFVNKVKLENLKEDDLITFPADLNYDGEKEYATYYIYSITELNDGGFLYQVIAEGAPVPYTFSINSNDVIGGYAFRIPVLGTIIEFVKSPFGIGAILVNILIISGIVIIVKQGQNPTVEKVEEIEEVDVVKEIEKEEKPEATEKQDTKEPKKVEEPVKVKKETKEIKEVKKDKKA
jgi:signal peptidase